MTTPSSEIIDRFLSILRRKGSIQEFESWLYDSEELLEQSLGKETYFNLVDLNYRSKSILDELDLVLIKILDYKSYDDFMIRDMLVRLVHSEEDFVSSCRKIYSEYCNGYSFLRIIALEFIMYDYDDQLDEPRIRKEFITEYREKFVNESLRILGFLETNAIEIIDVNEYIDLRSNEEKIEERY